MNAVGPGDSSPLLVTRLAKELREKHQEGFLQDFPWLADSDHWAVDLFWERLSQYRLARLHCARNGGDYRRDGSIRPAATRADKHWAALMQLLDKLGGTPASRFSMRLNALEGDDLASRAARLRNGT